MRHMLVKFTKYLLLGGRL